MHFCGLSRREAIEVISLLNFVFHDHVPLHILSCNYPIRWRVTTRAWSAWMSAPQSTSQLQQDRLIMPTSSIHFFFFHSFILFLFSGSLLILYLPLIFTHRIFTLDLPQLADLIKKNIADHYTSKYSKSPSSQGQASSPLRDTSSSTSSSRTQPPRYDHDYDDDPLIDRRFPRHGQGYTPAYTFPGQRNPLRIGDDDLNPPHPFYGGGFGEGMGGIGPLMPPAPGGGMYVGPNHPMFGGRPSLIRPPGKVKCEYEIDCGLCTHV